MRMVLPKRLFWKKRRAWEIRCTQAEERGTRTGDMLHKRRRQAGEIDILRQKRRGNAREICYTKGEETQGRYATQKEKNRTGDML
jgi:hypothetical protein